MDDVEEQEKKGRALRKRKLIVKLEESDSSDSYNPSEDHESDTSDDSVLGISRNVKKKKKTSHNDAEFNDEESAECIPKIKKKVKRNTKQTKKKSKRGRPPLDKSIAKEIKKMSQDSLRKRKIETTEQTRQSSLGCHSVTGHWYIASGYMKDLPALFEAYDEQDSWRFTAFATCWQKYKFSLVYRGRYDFKELIEFTEEICFWTKKFLSPIHAMKWRVGALYVLYGLYHKHPFRHLFKIRMEMNEFENLISLVRSFESGAGNPDPSYIFYKLMADGVFYYVASADEMGLQLYNPERQQDIMNYEMQWILQEHTAEAILPERKRNIQKNLMEEYMKTKAQLWGNGKELDKAMSYVEPSILSEVNSVLSELHKDAPHQTTLHKQASDDNNLSHAASTNMSEIGQRVSDIRRKAAALSTTDDFLQRKLLRSPQKSAARKDNQHDRKSITFSDNDTNEDDRKSITYSDNDSNEEEILTVHDHNKAGTLKEIMSFMQPSNETVFDHPIESFNFLEKRKNHPNNAECNSHSANACKILDSHDELLANDPPEEEDLKANEYSCQQLMRKRTSLPKQNKITRRHKIDSLKNTYKCEALEDSQITENNEILERKSAPRKLSKKNVLLGKASVTRKQKELQSDNIKKEKNEKVLESETCPLVDEQNKPKNTSKKKYSILGRKEKLEKLNKPSKVPSYNIDGTISPAGTSKENSSTAMNENLPKKNCKEICDQVITRNKACEKVCKEEPITSYVYEKGCDDQTVASNNVHEQCFGDELLNVTTNLPNASNVGINLTGIKNEQNYPTTSDTNDMENTINISQTNCSDVEKMLQVEILARIPEKKSLQSSLKAEDRVYVEVHFHEGNVKVHSAKFKMTKTDLKTLQNNKKKLNSLKKKFHSLLPSKYKNYQLHLQLNINQSVIEENETSEKKQRKPGLFRKHSKQDYKSPEKLKQDCDSSSEKHSKQGFKAKQFLPQAFGTVTKTNNSIPHQEFMTSYKQKGKVSSPMTASSLKQEPCDDVNLVRKVIQVEILASVPQEQHFQFLTKAKRKAVLDVNFQVDKVTIYHKKFHISIRDFESLQKNKRQLENLKVKFLSFLPSEFQNYEMQLQLNVMQLATEGNGTLLQHSRQDSDSSEILPQAPAMLWKENNTTPHTEASTSPSQKCLSKTFANAHSKSSAFQSPHKVPNTVERNEYYSSEQVDQVQESSSTATQRSHHLEDNTHIYLSNTSDKLSELLPVKHQAVIYVDEVCFSSQDYCCEINPAYVMDDSMEENNMCPQILPLENIVPTTHVESKPDIALMDETITPSQVCGSIHKKCFPKSLDSLKSMLTVPADDNLVEPGHNFMNNSLSTSSLDKYTNPNVNDKNSKNTTSIELCTKELGRENCTLLWKGRSDSNTMNDQNLLTSLPFSNSSSEHFKIIREDQGKAVTKTERMTPDLSLNADPDKPIASTSKNNDTPMNNMNLLSSLSQNPSKSMSENLLESARTDTSLSKAKNDSVCTYKFFSKRNKYSSSVEKQTISSSNSGVKKPVPFLFMDKLLGKKKQ